MIISFLAIFKLHVGFCWLMWLTIEYYSVKPRLHSFLAAAWIIRCCVDFYYYPATTMLTVPRLQLVIINIDSHYLDQQRARPLFWSFQTLFFGGEGVWMGRKHGYTTCITCTCHIFGYLIIRVAHHMVYTLVKLYSHFGLNKEKLTRAGFELCDLQIYMLVLHTNWAI